VKIALTKF